MKTALRWLFGILFILAGLNHFRSPNFYINIMPPYLPWHRELVAISGVADTRPADRVGLSVHARPNISLTRPGANVRVEVSLAARPPLAGQSSLSVSGL